MGHAEGIYEGQIPFFRALTADSSNSNLVTDALLRQTRKSHDLAIYEHTVVEYSRIISV